jgi:small subunit ribosomal protein S8
MDTIANFLTAIRNASSKGLEKTDVPLSKEKIALAKILKEEGYIQSYRIMEENQKPFLRILLKYTETHAPLIKGIKRVSSPGLRVYEGYQDISQIRGAVGIVILSTSKGVMTDQKARKMKVGGEVLCHVW